ncbi:MAG TPA: diphosphate--fructose-6-phosphate 1-phosphotransferase [Rhabdochlamydiaceae bacterium]|jgi:pyrophosphate--fructose-6-phosphate 1-phosphotransferase
MKEKKLLQHLREGFITVLPDLFSDLSALYFAPTEEKAHCHPKIEELFPLTAKKPFLKAKLGSPKSHLSPLKVGVVFSGGQAAGGHNVISGLWDALQKLHSHSRLFGFLSGPSGICSGKYKELTKEIIQSYRNQGGFDLIGSGRSKIETQEQLSASLDVVRSLQLDGLVIIGGDDSNTNAAVLAEFFLKNACPVRVIGVPKTIDGDLKNAYVATSFGFDTACKVYSEMIGNIARDVLSAKKYYHFIRLMGRSASHIALECALATQPNAALIGEEVFSEKKTLKQLVESLADLICKRASQGKHFGLILVPEGLIEFLPEVSALIKELNKLLAASADLSAESVHGKLSGVSESCFFSLPAEIQNQLLLNRDPHGNVQVSFIETEKLLMQMVQGELAARKEKGSYAGSYNPVNHFFGYEGRSAFPSNFDCNYCYALGFTAALLIENGITGYMCALQNLTSPPAQWKIGAVALTSLMHMELRKGEEKPVIQKALVDLKGKAFAYFCQHREQWASDDVYLFPGPIQFFGPPAICDAISHSLQLE